MSARVQDSRRFLRCSVCGGYYDLLCANVAEERFRNTLTGEHRDAWKCALCVSVQPKFDNTNTPVRSATSDGVTIRRGAAINSPLEPLEVSVISVPEPACGDSAVDMSSLGALITEMRLFRQELTATRIQMSTLNETMSKLTSRMGACESRVNKLDERMEALERRINGGHEERPVDSSLLAAVEQLKSELNERDQELLMNDIEISCITEQKGENLSHNVITLANKLGVSIGEQDIVSATRVGRPPETPEPSASATRPRLIVVRLARRAVRDQLLQAARVRRGATTEGTGLPGPSRRFYVNERLTRTNRLLFRRAREIAGRLNWRYVWTRDGRVFARQHQGGDAPRHRLRTEEDLGRVFGPGAIGSSVNDNK